MERRELKFRVWLAQEKKMLSDKGDGFYDYMMTLDGDLEKEDDIEFRCFEMKKTEYVIMQFTGLHDKNGKEIYEGDIVKVRRSDSFRDYANEVYFVDGGFFTEWYHPLEEKYKAVPIYAWPVKIIGNIYENPELLEEKSEVD